MCCTIVHFLSQIAQKLATFAKTVNCSINREKSTSRASVENILIARTTTPNKVDSMIPKRLADTFISSTNALNLWAS